MMVMMDYDDNKNNNKNNDDSCNSISLTDTVDII